MKATDQALLIAPCGINCGACRAHLRKRNKCAGCRSTEISKSKARTLCSIKTCEVFSSGEARFCSDCKNFPCGNLKRLDKRYRTKYNVGLIDNLSAIKSFGIRKFLKEEKARRTCKECGGVVCLHTGKCACCGSLHAGPALNNN